MSGRRDWARLVIGCLGLAIAASGVVLFLVEMGAWLDSAQWRVLSLRGLLEDPMIGSILPRSLLAWLSKLDPLGLRALADTILDGTPAPAFLVVLGGAIGWKALR